MKHTIFIQLSDACSFSFWYASSWYVVRVRTHAVQVILSSQWNWLESNIQSHKMFFFRKSHFWLQFFLSYFTAHTKVINFRFLVDEKHVNLTKLSSQIHSQRSISEWYSIAFYYFRFHHAEQYSKPIESEQSIPFDTIHTTNSWWIGLGWTWTYPFRKVSFQFLTNQITIESNSSNVRSNILFTLYWCNLKQITICSIVVAVNTVDYRCFRC